MISGWSPFAPLCPGSRATTNPRPERRVELAGPAERVEVVEPAVGVAVAVDDVRLLLDALPVDALLVDALLVDALLVDALLVRVVDEALGGLDDEGSVEVGASLEVDGDAVDSDGVDGGAVDDGDPFVVVDAGCVLGSVDEEAGVVLGSGIGSLTAGGEVGTAGDGALLNGRGARSSGLVGAGEPAAEGSGGTVMPGVPAGPGEAFGRAAASRAELVALGLVATGTPQAASTSAAMLDPAASTTVRRFNGEVTAQLSQKAH